MADPKRMKRAAIGGWLVRCCTVAVSLGLSAQIAGAVTVTVATGNGVQGGSLTLTLSLTRQSADPILAGTQVDVLFHTSQIQIGGACSDTGASCNGSSDCAATASCNFPCAPDPRLIHQSFSATLVTTVRPPDPTGTARLRLAIFDNIQFPTASFDTGALATCTFQVPANAVPNQPVSLTTDRVVVSDNNDDTVPGVQVQVNPGTILPAPTLTPTPTVTPTPYPCFVDKDCPLGQVCGSDKRCQPAPTPTPTIACPDQNCPDGLTCVSGICRDLSTPTPTPTPLPTCMTDQDCVNLEGSGFHCRAGVCVPIRECDRSDPTVDLKNCRGDRETCVNDECECGGDCNLDGYVFGNEITQMICVLNEQPQCPLSSTCPAGDFNGDGHITGDEVCQAVTNLGLGCPAEGQPLVFGFDRSNETRSLDIGSASGFPGDSVTIPISLSIPGDSNPADGDVATAQLDLIFDTTVLDIPDPASACTVDPRLQATDATFTFLPQTPNTPAGMARLRLFVGNLDLCPGGAVLSVMAFTQGTLLSCTFHIDPSAPAGDSPLTAERLNVGDPLGDSFGTASTSGNVKVLLPPTGTPTATATAGTPTAGTPTATPIVGTPTATPIVGTPTATTTAATATPAAATPTRTPVPTNTSAPTSSVPATNTPAPPKTSTPTPTGAKSPTAVGGGGGGGCNIAAPAPATDHPLLWLLVMPATLLVRRRSFGR